MLNVSFYSRSNTKNISEQINRTKYLFHEKCSRSHRENSVFHQDLLSEDISEFFFFKKPAEFLNFVSCSQTSRFPDEHLRDLLPHRFVEWSAAMWPSHSCKYLINFFFLFCFVCSFPISRNPKCSQPLLRRSNRAQGSVPLHQLPEARGGMSSPGSPHVPT